MNNIEKTLSIVGGLAITGATALAFSSPGSTFFDMMGAATVGSLSMLAVRKDEHNNFLKKAFRMGAIGALGVCGGYEGQVKQQDKTTSEYIQINPTLSSTNNYDDKTNEFLYEVKHTTFGGRGL